MTVDFETSQFQSFSISASVLDALFGEPFKLTTPATNPELGGPVYGHAFGHLLSGYLQCNQRGTALEDPLEAATGGSSGHSYECSLCSP